MSSRLLVLTIHKCFSGDDKVGIWYVQAMGVSGRITPKLAGLCASCVHARIITSDRGSTFLLCQLSFTDPSFARYPRLPVLSCPGYRQVIDSTREKTI